MNDPHVKFTNIFRDIDLSVNNSDKVHISLHNPGLSSPPVIQETQNGNSNGDQFPNFNGSSSLSGPNGDPVSNGGQVPAYNGFDQAGSGSMGSAAQKMSAPRRGRGVLQQQEPGMRVPVCGFSGEPIRCLAGVQSAEFSLECCFDSPCS